MVKIKIENKDSFTKKKVIHCDEASVDDILAWYGAYHMGDQYKVKINGKQVLLDQNGERVK